MIHNKDSGKSRQTYAGTLIGVAIISVLVFPLWSANFEGTRPTLDIQFHSESIAAFRDEIKRALAAR